MTYFDCLNIAEEKIIEQDFKKENFNICEICSKKMLNT